MDKVISDQVRWEEQFVKKLEKKVQVLEDRCDMRGAVQAQEREQWVARQQSELAQEMVGIKERVFSLEQRSANSHGCWTCADILENGVIASAVANVVATKDNSPLVFVLRNVG